MKERPILFSGAMVRAILEGRKTQTRRSVHGIDFRGGGGPSGADWNDPSCWGFESEDVEEWALAAGPGVQRVIPCPYGVSGDRLWVRETWAADEAHCFCEGGCGHHSVIYRANQSTDIQVMNGWRPSIHMPRWASRITLEITDVRVQRLQEISNDDISAEGVEGLHPCGGAFPTQWRERWASLWDSINRKRAPWSSNPWIWALTFRTLP